MDLLPYEKNVKDEYKEILESSDFEIDYRYKLWLRNRVYDDVISKQIPDPKHPFELTLKAIIGRRAFTRRNNLFYDYDGRIIYVASTQIVQLPADKSGETLIQS